MSHKTQQAKASIIEIMSTGSPASLKFIDNGTGVLYDNIP